MDAAPVICLSERRGSGDKHTLIRADQNAPFCVGASYELCMANYIVYRYVTTFVTDHCR